MDILAISTWEFLTSVTKALFQSEIVANFTQYLDPVLWLTQLLGLIGYVFELAGTMTDEDTRNTLNSISGFLNGDFIAQAAKVGMFFVGKIVHAGFFIAIVKLQFAWWAVMVLLKSVLKFISFFWAGGGN